MNRHIDINRKYFGYFHCIYMYNIISFVEGGRVYHTFVMVRMNIIGNISKSYVTKGKTYHHYSCTLLFEKNEKKIVHLTLKPNKAEKVSFLFCFELKEKILRRLKCKHNTFLVFMNYETNCMVLSLFSHLIYFLLLLLAHLIRIFRYHTIFDQTKHICFFTYFYPFIFSHFVLLSL